MICEPAGFLAGGAASRFALGVGLRAALLAGIVFLALKLLADHHLYVTTVLLAVISAGALAELTAYVSRGDRMLAQLVDGLVAGDIDHPAAGPAAGFELQQRAITRAVAALESVRQQREQEIQGLRTLLDTVSVALIVLNPEGTVTLANAAARRLAGRDVSRLEQIPPVGADAAAQLTRLAPGERRVVHLASGQRVLALCAQLSVSGTSRRLLSLQNIAGELDAVEIKAWQDVLRVLAHEIMNSLTPIASLAQSVRPRVNQLRVASTREDTAQQAADVQDAIEAIARRSTGLVSFVSRYRRLAELPPPVLRPVRLAELLRHIDQLMSATLVAHAVTYVSQVEPPDLTVPVDRDLLEQLLMNLIHNAIEACSGVQQPRIEVSARYRDENVLIEIADNGRGIEPATLERIFVPLFTTRPGGSGIGLSLARQIAHAHGGTLGVRTRTPRGALFTLLIPERRPVSGTNPVVAAEDGAPPAAPGRGGHA